MREKKEDRIKDKIWEKALKLMFLLGDDVDQWVIKWLSRFIKFLFNTKKTHMAKTDIKKNFSTLFALLNKYKLHSRKWLKFILNEILDKNNA